MNHLALRRILNTTFIIIQIMLGVGFYLKNQNLYVFESILILSIFLLVVFLEKNFNFYVENYIRLLVITALIMHLLIGEFFEIYYTSFVFDKMLHFFGTFSYTLLFYSIITRSIKLEDNSRLFKFIFISSLGISLGTFFEMLEFGADTFLNAYSQKGLLDTDLDLLFNIIGSCLAGIFANTIGSKFLPSS